MVPSFTDSENGSSGNFHFYGSSGGQPAPVSWAWTYGDGATDSGQNVSHNYPNSPASFTVTLTVTNGTCHASVSHTVTP